MIKFTFENVKESQIWIHVQFHGSVTVVERKDELHLVAYSLYGYLLTTAPPHPVTSERLV